MGDDGGEEKKRLRNEIRPTAPRRRTSVRRVGILEGVLGTSGSGRGVNVECPEARLEYIQQLVNFVGR